MVSRGVFPVPRSRRALRALALNLLALAGLLDLTALRHMAAAAADGFICGVSPSHCPACPAGLVATLLGLGALALAYKPEGRAALRRARAAIR